MKKIVIVTREMVAGGIETSLINMLEQMSSEEYEVTLYVMYKGGEFEKFLPEWVDVKCIYGEAISKKEMIYNYVKEGKLITAIRVLYYTILSIISKSYFKQNIYLFKSSPKDKTEYDLLITYHAPASFCVIYSTEFLKAKKKIAWVHSDVEKCEDEMKLYTDNYNLFDKIFCVSKSALNKFNNLYPKLSDKTDLFYNIINKENIYNKSLIEKSYEDNFDGIRILTVGRMSEEKGYRIIPSVVKKLLSNGYKIKWYCIGDGPLSDKLKEDIIDENLQNNIILMGTKLNPYPFIKDCDIYVQPSIYEGYCITLAEARLFNKPIVSTNFTGANEQLVDGKTGLIVNYNEDEIYRSISKIIDDRLLCSIFSYNLSKNKNYEQNINKLLSDILK